MKIRLCYIFTLLLCSTSCSHNNSEAIVEKSNDAKSITEIPVKSSPHTDSCILYVNGKKCIQDSECLLSKSEENLLTIELKGCEHYRLSSNGAIITKHKDGFVAEPRKDDVVKLWISCEEENGELITLASYLLKVVP